MDLYYGFTFRLFSWIRFSTSKSYLEFYLWFFLLIFFYYYILRLLHVNF